MKCYNIAEWQIQNIENYEQILLIKRCIYV